MRLHTLAFGLLVWPAGAAIADNVADFYRGKTVTMVVGTPAGGGYDIYARLLVRHLAKHIPGNPTIIVQNKPGAGSVIAANYVMRWRRRMAPSFCRPRARRHSPSFLASRERVTSPPNSIGWAA
jgi:tripartite-type tricarboxylate transporter receptor subunit TctC